jgi:hypothetical protein
MEELSRLPESVRKLMPDRFHLLQPDLEEGRALRSFAIEAGISYIAIFAQPLGKGKIGSS